MFYQKHGSEDVWLMRGEAVYGPDEEPVYIMEHKKTGKIHIMDKVAFNSVIFFGPNNRVPLWTEIRPDVQFDSSAFDSKEKAK